MECREEGNRMVTMECLRGAMGRLRREDLEALQRVAERAMANDLTLLGLDTAGRSTAQEEEDRRRQAARDNARPADAVARVGRKRIYLPGPGGRPYQVPGDLNGGHE